VNWLCSHGSETITPTPDINLSEREGDGDHKLERRWSDWDWRRKRD